MNSRGKKAVRNSAPSIFTVVSDLGLKLESRKAPFEVIVIDSGDKVPTKTKPAPDVAYVLLHAVSRLS